jgi:integrase
MSAEMAELCRQYARIVDLSRSKYFFFYTTGCASISMNNLNQNFRRFLYRAGISHGGKGKGPRIYDFRHTYAVNCLKRFAESGTDMNRYHQILKTYMGHSHFKDTAYYLRLTKDMFPDIRKKLENRYGDMLPMIGEIEYEEDN